VKKSKRKRWFSIAVYAVILIGISIGSIYLFQYLVTHFDISVEEFATTAYLLVFVTTLIGNASIIVPVAIHIAVMITAASEFDPILIALIASIAGTLGEITGYYAGYLGKKIIVRDTTPGYTRVVGWMEKYGPWTIFFLSLQPILPFDIAGLVAGAFRMPLWKFLVFCWAGRFPKYIVLCYFGSAIPYVFPSWFQ
jgi:membrane protein YqaA with SNARE-associated domain